MTNRNDVIKEYTKQDRMQRLNNWQRDASGCGNGLAVIGAVIIGTVWLAGAVLAVLKHFG